jgi:hypothetical protein
MERIKDGRRNILIHGNATAEDLPVKGLPEMPKIAGIEPFVPANMDEPKLYPGDVVVGFYDGEIQFAELIYDKTDTGVLVVPLDTGIVTLHEDAQFSRRFYQADETHIYDDVTDEIPDWDVEFDESKLERPETSRAR